MSRTDIDPITAMNAAVISVGNGEAGEIEIIWVEDLAMGGERRLQITVRRDVQQINVNRGDT